jgi:hypothetical protein
LDDCIDPGLGDLDYDVEILGRSGHRVVGRGEGTGQHVGDTGAVEHIDDRAEECRQTHGTVGSVMP